MTDSNVITGGSTAQPGPPAAPPLSIGATGNPTAGTVRFFGREPALWLGLVAVLVQIAGLVFNLSADQQAVMNALAVAVAGAIAAYVVHEGQVAALLAAFKAAVALAFGFGLDLPPQDQAVAMALLTAVSALVVRSQVVAPVARSGRRVLAADVTEGRV